jgi:hypothetical protein
MHCGVIQVVVVIPKQTLTRAAALVILGSELPSAARSLNDRCGAEAPRQNRMANNGRFRL